MDKEKLNQEMLATGLSGKTLRLAHVAKELEEKKGIAIWGQWRLLNDFPVAEGTTTVTRCQFIDAHLKGLLDKKAHPTRPNYYRPDLNGTGGTNRAWLMKIVLQRTINDAKTDHLNTASDTTSSHGNYIFPEDLPKIVDDIHTLHKFHNQLPLGQRSLTSFKTPEALRDTVKPFRPKYVLPRSEKLAAHKKFLKDDNHNGNGDAKLVGRLENGTEVLHILSEDASLAYGSPRWCVSYREKKTYFKTYKKDLLFVLDPNGERWGIHFTKGQFMDADDRPIKDFKEFLDDRPGLTELLTPYLIRGLQKDDFRTLWVADQIPEWQKHLRVMWPEDYAMWDKDPHKCAEAWQATLTSDLCKSPENADYSVDYCNFWLVKFMELDPERIWPIFSSFSLASIAHHNNLRHLRNYIYKTDPFKFADATEDYYVQRINKTIESQDCEGYVDMLLGFINDDNARAPQILKKLDTVAFGDNDMKPLENKFWELCPDAFADHLQSACVYEISHEAEQKKYAAGMLLKFVTRTPERALSILEELDPDKMGYGYLEKLEKKYESFTRKNTATEFKMRYSSKCLAKIVNMLQTYYSIL